MLDWLSTDGKLILLAKSARTFSFGFIAIIFTVYLSQLGLSPSLVGFAVTITLFSSAAITLLISLGSGRLGQRWILLILSLMLTASAALLISFQNAIVVVIAAIIGNVSVSAGETGPFLSVEQALLPGCADYTRRNYLFSLYNLIGYTTASLGALVAGVPQLFEENLGTIVSYQPLFLIYLATAIINIVAYSRFSPRPQTLEYDLAAPNTISDRSRSIITKLSLLFALDSFGGGFFVQTILSYWFYTRFGASLSELGIVFFATQVVTALSFLASAKIASRIGLINTMVFTHLPSNIIIMAIPFAPNFPVAALLLVGRHLLSQMDVPARQSYVVAVVDESDRTRAAGITNVSRTLAQAVSPSIAGYAIQVAAAGVPFILGGGLKIIYDLLLFFGFRRIRPPEERLPGLTQP